MMIRRRRRRRSTEPTEIENMLMSDEEIMRRFRSFPSALLRLSSSLYKRSLTQLKRTSWCWFPFHCRYNFLRPDIAKRASGLRVFLNQLPITRRPYLTTSFRETNQAVNLPIKLMARAECLLISLLNGRWALTNSAFNVNIRLHDWCKKVIWAFF